MKPSIHEERRSLLWCGILAPLLFVSTTLLLGQLQPDYDHLRQTVSELGSPGRPYAFWFNLNFALSGALLVLFAVALRKPLGQRAGPLILGIIGLLNVLGALFPIDPERPESVSSVVHITLGVMMLLAFVLAFASLQTRLRREHPVARFRSALTVCGGIGVSGILLTLGSPSWTGLGQRVFYLGFFGWLAALALPLLRNEERRATRE